MRTKLCPLCVVLALIASIHSVPAQPTLGIIQTNNQSLLYWPSDATGYVLQSTTNLAAPAWTPATDATPASYGSQAAMTVTNGSSARFFRLFQSVVITTPDGMALIPAGEFTMGDAVDNTPSATETNVYVSAFYMETNLVSYSEWTSNYSYATSHGYAFDHAGYGKEANHPVTIINWYDAIKWCNARSQQAGLTPVYYTDAGFTQVYTNGDIDITNANVNWSANGYRLPTEAEWEKAARGGLAGQRFPWGDTISESQANYNGDPGVFSYDLGPTGFNTNFYTGSPPFTSPVGSFAPNGYGLFDMAGNLYEWCWDWYGAPYAGGSDPQGPASGTSRVVRGGDWDDTADDARTGIRNLIGPSSALSYWGFRCVRNVPSSTTSDGMALIPAGEFTIGNSAGDSDFAYAPTNVYISAFYMDTNLVRLDQWQLAYAYATGHGYGFDNAGYAKASNYPVGYMNWYDVVKWCNARSQQAGLTPVYYTDAGMTLVYTNHDTDAVYANWSANGYRLPTSAEWEKAARGGLSGQRFPWGMTISESQANYNGHTNNFYDLGPEGSNTNYNSGYPYTSPVGTFAPNGYGLYDMAGNMEEWCWDWAAGPPYPAGSPYLGGTDPRGPTTITYYRVLRGGSWASASDFTRCAYPNIFPPSGATGSVGFRCVRNL